MQIYVFHYTAVYMAGVLFSFNILEEKQIEEVA